MRKKMSINPFFISFCEENSCKFIFSAIIYPFSSNIHVKHVSWVNSKFKGWNITHTHIYRRKSNICHFFFSISEERVLQNGTVWAVSASMSVLLYFQVSLSDKIGKLWSAFLWKIKRFTLWVLFKWLFGV